MNGDEFEEKAAASECFKAELQTVSENYTAVSCVQYQLAE